MLGIVYEPDLKQLKEAISVVLRANGLSDGYIRWSVSAGESAIGLPSDLYNKPNEIVYAKELAVDEPASRRGKTLRLLKLPRSSPEGSIRLKSFHYMNNIVAQRELIGAGAGAGTEGLFLDHNGNVAEGMVSNVFWVKSGVLHTPSALTGLLEGITREYVLEMAVNRGIKVKEGLFIWDDLLNADEVFVTNSIQEIVPVVYLENDQGQGHPPGGKGVAGTITYQLMTEYRDAAERKDL